ncbi:MAG: hypothetical protein MRZ60_12810 [Blautia sp.]|nr:hypothetical protein [Blautia sp.]
MCCLQVSDGEAEGGGEGDGDQMREKPVISKKEFLNCENKDEIMSECLKRFVNADQCCAEPGRNSREQEEKQRILDIQNDISSIRNNITEKKEKLELLRSLTLNRQTYLRNAAHISEEDREHQIRLLQDELENMEERFRCFTANMEREMEAMKKESMSIRGSKRSSSAELLCRITGQIPPSVYRSAVHAIDQFHIRNLKREKKYICQCKPGIICHECSEEGGELLSRMYPDAVVGRQLEVPYILDRNHAVYQLFLYKEPDKDTVWQHFQTMCLGQMILHRCFDYEITVVLEEKDRQNESCFLSDIRDFDSRTKINVIHPRNLEEVLYELEGYCTCIQENFLGEEYDTIWNYNSRHPAEKLPYKGIALWDFPYGVHAGIPDKIYRMYNVLESCGVFFLFFVNDDFDGDETVIQGVRKIMESFPVVVYNHAVRGYEALGDRNYVYKIEEYDNL